MAKVEPISADTKIDIKPSPKRNKPRLLKPITKPILPLSNPIFDMLLSIMGIFIIFPAVVYGMFTFFGAGFKAGMDAAVKMYNELVDDAKTWGK